MNHKLAKLYLGIIGALFIVTVSFSFAQQADETQTRLKNLQRVLEAQSAQNKELKSRQDELEQKLNDLKTKLNEIRVRVSRAS